MCRCENAKMGIGGRGGGFGVFGLRRAKKCANVQMRKCADEKCVNVQLRKSRIGGTSCADVQMKI